jgi:endoglucanase
MCLRIAFAALAVLSALAVDRSGAAVQAPAGSGGAAARVAKLLGRGVNFGNALEAPSEGAWGMRILPEYAGVVRKAVFQSVRIPIKWSAHALAEAPYTIEPAFFRRVDQALSAKLAVVINVHHYDEIYKEPERHQARLVALWKQIAEHYRRRPESVVFELLNEPNAQLTDEKWNAMVPQLLAAIRPSNPRRAVIVGPGSWNSVKNLPKLELPEEDRMLIATFHYYNPFQFTHQGAEWSPGSEKWLGTKWTGSPQETAAVARDFDIAAKWGREHDRPVYVGEFGAYSKADMESRARWTSAIARAAEERGIPWAYWEFGAGFGAYDRDARSWRAPLLGALVPG